MGRISLKDQYDNKDVIQQIYRAKDAIGAYTNDIADANTKADEALATANAFGARITKVESDIAKIDDNDVLGLAIEPVINGVFKVSATKKQGDLDSNAYNYGKVKSAILKQGSAGNSFYAEITLTDDTVVKTNELVLGEIVPGDVYLSSLTLVEGPNDHTLTANMTLTNGQTFSSNTVAYDYPVQASNGTLGLVKGSSADGECLINVQGVPVVNGWEALKSQVNGKQDAGDYATKTELTSGLNSKQDTGDYATRTELSNSLSGKQDKLTAGNNITIEGNTISASGGAGATVTEVSDNAQLVRYMRSGNAKQGDVLAGQVIGFEVNGKDRVRINGADFRIVDYVEWADSTEITLGGFAPVVIDWGSGAAQAIDGFCYLMKFELPNIADTISAYVEYVPLGAQPTGNNSESISEVNVKFYGIDSFVKG